MASSIPKEEPAAPPGLSFAKVAAASAHKETVTLSYAKMAAANLQTAKPADKPSNEKSKLVEKVEKKDAASPEKSENKAPAASNVQKEGTLDDSESLADSFRKVSISPCLVVNGSSPVKDSSMSAYPASFPEDVYQRNDSGSDIGTKPPSLDGKSITSGTTFALDEKESLRPDDSASVKAAEDDDTFSGRGSIVAGSRIGSEAAARAYHSQIYDAQRRSMLPPLESQPQGTLTPQSGSSGQLVAGNLPQQSFKGVLPTKDDFHNIFYKTSPDEKLMEAMEEPRNRIFLLRLEQDVINFVRDTKEPYFDVPPSNSFCRMLTHKLADYYHLTHQYDSHANQGSVRIFRTPFCRLPETLSSISTPPTAENTPPPVPAMKILRRGGNASTSPSKPTSEDGSEGKEKKKDMKGLTLEEKQAHYEATRLRIFGKEDGKSGDVTPDTEEGRDMSRSSSVSGRNKSSKPKRRPRNDSDTFESRSAFWQFNPALFIPQGPSMGNQYGQMGYNQSVYTPPMSTYMPQMPQMANSQQFQQFPEYQQMPMQSYGSPAMQPSPQPGASWVQPPFQPSPRLGQQYANSNPQQRTPVQGTTIPYAYGQLPASASTNPADPKSQHPIPGSFNRHAFNPKTQSFVPGGGAVSRSGSQQGSQHGSPQPMRYGGFASPHLQSQQQFQGGMGQMGGFGIQMSRQSSNASMGGMPVQMQSGVRSYHASPHMMARPLPLPQQYPNQVQMQMQQGVQMMPMMQAQQMQGGVQMQQMQQAVLVPSMNGHGQTGQMTLMTPGSVQMGAALQNVGGVVMLNLQHPANQPVQNQQMQGQGPQIMGQMGGGMMQGQMMGGGGYQGQGGQGQGQMGYYPPGPQGQGPKGPGQA